jgi:hypothetical protein
MAPATAVPAQGAASAAPAATAAAAITVPGQVEDGNCTDAERAAAPDACTWAVSTDAVVWGVLRDIRLVDAPAIAAWNTGAKWQWAQGCDAIDPALELVIDVQRVLSGDRSLSGALTVKVGARQRQHFDPMPVLDAGGRLAWEKIGTSSGGALRIGQPIGLPIHYIAEFGVWSLMGERPFTLDAGGAIALQDRRGSCSEPAPAAVIGQSLDGLGRALASCPASAAGDARRARTRALWGAAQDPTAFLAALCFRKQAPLAAGTCVATSDCAGRQTCVAGVCRGS